MSKEEFIEHMSAFLYRIRNQHIRNDLEAALTKYENDEPSEQDKARMARIADLRVGIKKLEDDIAAVDKTIEWKTPEHKSIDETIKDIARDNGGGIIIDSHLSPPSKIFS